MRPSPGDTVVSAAAILKEHITPFVPATDRAARALEGVIAALEKIGATWDQVVPHLVAENREMRALINRLAAALPARDDSALAHFRNRVDALPACAGGEGGVPRFADANDENLRLREVLIDAIDLLEPADAAQRLNVDAERFQSEIRRWLRTWLDRDIALSGTSITARRE